MLENAIYSHIVILKCQIQFASLMFSTRDVQTSVSLPLSEYRCVSAYGNISSVDETLRLLFILKWLSEQEFRQENRLKQRAEPPSWQKTIGGSSLCAGLAFAPVGCCGERQHPANTPGVHATLGRRLLSTDCRTWRHHAVSRARWSGLGRS